MIFSPGFVRKGSVLSLSITTTRSFQSKQLQASRSSNPVNVIDSEKTLYWLLQKSCVWRAVCQYGSAESSHSNCSCLVEFCLSPLWTITSSSSSSSSLSSDSALVVSSSSSSMSSSSLSSSVLCGFSYFYNTFKEMRQQQKGAFLPARAVSNEHLEMLTCWANLLSIIM